MITGLILFLLLHPGEPVYALIAVSAAMLLKYFMNYKGSPVVNPAVFGLLVAVGVGHWLPNVDSAFVSWWGTAYSPYYVSLIIVGAWIILGLNKWRKLPIFLSFMVVHVLLLTLRGMGMDFIWYTLTDSTIYFLAAAMLTEPKTSPLRYQQQAQFGAVGAIAYNILMHYSAPYFALWAIVFANAANLLFKPKKRKKKLVARATAAEE